MKMTIFLFSTLHRIAVLPFHLLFHNLCSDILVYFYKHHDFLKEITGFFFNKSTQDSAEFWEISGNFKAKTKTEDEGILKKGKWSSS